MSIDSPASPDPPPPPRDPPDDSGSPGWGDHMDPILAENVEAMRDQSALLRGQGNEDGARASDAEADKFEAMISEDYLAHTWNPAEDRVRALERSTLTRDVRDGPNYADQLLDAGGFTGTAEKDPQVHDYTSTDVVHTALSKEAGEAIGLPGTPRELKEIELKHDVWVCQYYDPALPMDEAGGRSHKYWTPIDPADIPRLPEGKQFEKAEEGSALPPRTWDGVRSHVQIALIPAGTVIKVGEVDPQSEKDLAPKISDAMDPSGSLPPELVRSHILESTISEVRIGGDVEIRFDRFDDGWIKGRAPIRF
jgi:hypothetical protein